MGQFIHLKGRCLCGAVAVEARTASIDLCACHCNICRKWGGGPLIHLEGGKDVALEGEENISLFSSSAWAERGFCKACGTHLFYRTSKDREYYLPAGLFDTIPDARLALQIFIDKKPNYYFFADETETMTEAEFAKDYPVA